MFVKCLFTLVCIAVSLCAYAQIPQDSIINKYAAVKSYDTCKNSYLVDDASGFGKGDTVLIIQMKGAEIDSTNTAAFGSILSYRGAGNHELNKVKSVSGNSIQLEYQNKRKYDIPDGKVQLIRVPSAPSHTLAQKLTCREYMNDKGGVAIMMVNGTLTLNADIDVSAKGFIGAQLLNITGLTCNQTDYYYPKNNLGAWKGEGIGEVSISKMFGRGALANGGGGGNSHNSGGAGGGNGGAGGGGGDQYRLTVRCTNIIPDLGGVGGRALDYTQTPARLFLGGGGGGGHTNEQTDKPGGYGGGIVILIARTIVGNGRSITSNGGNVIECTGPTPGCANDGHSGGGAGGTIVVAADAVTGNLNVSAKGGKGADAWVFASTVGTTGPGGGGGGGIIWYKNTKPAGAINKVDPGPNGVSPQNGNISWGAETGKPGKVLTNYDISFTQTPFESSANFVNVGGDTTICEGGSANIWATGGVSYEWEPPGTIDNPTAASTTVHPTKPTYYIVTATNADGCIDRDTVFVDVVPGPPLAITPRDSTVCSGSSILVRISGSKTYSWFPVNGVSDPTSDSTVIYITQPRTYYIKATDSVGCITRDSITVDVFPPFGVLASADPKGYGCRDTKINLFASGAEKYIWHPGNLFEDSTVLSPSLIVKEPTTFVVEGISKDGCVKYDSLFVGPDYKTIVLMPDVFTPNSDGLNDNIKPLIYCDFILESFMVYDRWGENVFTTEVVGDGWDGTYKGEPMQIGVYHYIITGKDWENKPVMMKGSFTLAL